MKKLLYLLIVLSTLASVALPVNWQIGSFEMGQGVARADTLTLQPSDKDNASYEDDPTGAYGTSISLYVSPNTNYRFNSLLEFDLATLPDEAIVDSATLSLYFYSHQGAGSMYGRTVTYYRLRRADWSESQSTWNIYKTSNNWTTAGAYDTTNDIDTSLSTTTTVPGSINNWMAADVKTLVEDAVANQSDKFIVKLCDLGSTTNLSD